MGSRSISAAEFHEVLAALSLAADAANGLQPETSLRTSILAVEMAKTAGFSEQERHAAAYAGLLRFLGCTAFAQEETAYFGADDVLVRRAFNGVDRGQRTDVLGAAWTATAGGGGTAHALRFAKVLSAAKRVRLDHAEAACEVGRLLASRLGMPQAVSRALAELFERWDGQGVPHGLAEEEVSTPARLLHAASIAEAFHRAGGSSAAAQELKQRAGQDLDPQLVQACLAEGPALFAALEEPTVWNTALDVAPPAPADLQLELVTHVFADFVDLKTPYKLGHSRRVAALAQNAGLKAGLGKADLELLRHAALLHDLGNVAVGNHIWEQASPLSPPQWEQVRLHPYHTDRVLQRSKILAPIGRLAATHHERCDGSGYPHGATKQTLPRSSRLLAAADVYAALCEPRPYRRAYSDSSAARILSADADAGRLDADAVACVLESVGQASALPQSQRLSPREVEVLSCVARGESNKDVARTLGISAKTVQHHVRSIYEKTEVRSRAGAALYAVENGIVDPGARSE